MESERRRSAAARASHVAELAARTELQHIIRACVTDVRADVEAAEAEVAGSNPGGGGSAHAHGGGGGGGTSLDGGRQLGATHPVRGGGKPKTQNPKL